VQQRLLALALALAHTEAAEHARHRRARASCNSRSLVKVLGRRDDRRRVAACSQLPGASAARFRAEYNGSLRMAVDITEGEEGAD